MNFKEVHFCILNTILLALIRILEPSKELVFCTRAEESVGFVLVLLCQVVEKHL